MILYHASTVKIDSFYIPYGGLHLGGMYSALEAALRKLRSDRNVDNSTTVYLHKVHLKVDTVLPVDDLGDDHSWRTMFSAVPDDIQALEYVNKYEPDVSKSYVVWDTSLVKIIEVDVMHMDEAEELIEEFLDEL